MVLEHTPVKASQNRMVWSYPAEANMTDIEEVVVYWMRVLLMSGVYLDKVIKNSSGEIGVSHIFRCGKKEKEYLQQKELGICENHICCHLQTNITDTFNHRR